MARYGCVGTSIASGEGPDLERIGQHQVRERVEDLRPRARVGRIARRVVVGHVGLVGRRVDERQQHERVALDQRCRRRRSRSSPARRRCRAGAAGCSAIVQLGGLVGADALHARDHARVVDAHVAAAALLLPSIAPRCRRRSAGRGRRRRCRRSRRSAGSAAVRVSVRGSTSDAPRAAVDRDVAAAVERAGWRGAGRAAGTARRRRPAGARRPPRAS